MSNMFNIPEFKDGETVIWSPNVEGEGYHKTFFGYGPCFKPWKMFQQQIMLSANDIVNSKYYLDNTIDDPKIIIGEKSRLYSALSMSEPPLLRDKWDDVLNDIKLLVLNKLSDIGTELSPDDSNAIFLAKLGKKRNWKHSCCVCLEDEIMGTTCKCGHTEIAIFRPCGHSLCVSPCFRGFVKDQIQLERRRIKCGDKEIMILNDNAVEIDLNDTNFSCPLCRVTVTSTFRAENVSFNENELSDLLDRDGNIKDLVEKYF